MESEQLCITLIAAPGDAPSASREYQKELENFTTLLDSFNPQVPALLDYMDAVAAPPHDVSETLTLLGQFVIALKPGLPALTPIASLLAAWCGARYGRKVRVKVGDIEVESHTSK